MVAESCEAAEATCALYEPTSTHHLPAQPLPFEAYVTQKSRRSGDPDSAVGYYVSFRLLHALNARSPPSEQVANGALHPVIQVSGNARMFKKASFAVHERVDEILIAASDAERPATLERSELVRLRQVAKHANQATFCERLKRIVPNGGRLLHKIQEELEAAIARYALDETNHNAALKDAEADTAAVVEIVDHCATAIFSPTDPSATTARRRSSSSRSSSLPRPAHPRFAVLQILNATVDSIRSDTSVHRAYEIWQKYPLRFAAYRAFFKNDHTQLATEIARNCVDKHTKKEIRKWIRAKIGAIPACNSPRNDGGRELPNTKEKGRKPLKQSAFFNWELRQLALAAAALTVYGEHVLSALYDANTMESLRDIPLVSDDVRDARKQKECLQRALATHSIVRITEEGGGVFHAAHYLPLDLSIQWNNALPPESRLSADTLRSILNRQCNLKAVPTRVNIKDHRKVEHFIAAFIKYGSVRKGKCATWLEWRNTKDRLDQIARRVQSFELRDAFLRANGLELYALIGRTFQQIETEFVDRGYEFGKIWDRQEVEETRDDARVSSHPLLRHHANDLLCARVASPPTVHHCAIDCLKTSDRDLAELQRQARRHYRNWIDTTIRSSPEYASMRAPKKQSGSTYSKVFLKTLRYLALVAAALVVYGEEELSARCDEKAMARWKNIALVSDEVRNFPEQKKCLRLSKVDRSARVSKEFPDQPGLVTEELAKMYHAAHYVPLDLVVQRGSKLAPENRLSTENMSYIFNQQCNLKAVPARVNQKDHRKVELLVAEVIRDGCLSKYKCKTWLECRQVVDRLIEIARKVQSREIRDALIKADAREDGREFYTLVGRTFQQIEKEFAASGFNFGKIWGREEEDDAVTVKAEAVLSQVAELDRV